MQPGVRRGPGIGAALASVIVVAAMATLTGQYSMTVNRDRLMNAQNEPQNWLMMNGDYASTSYSKLTQISRENVKDLRMVWALALGGMQDVGQNGPKTKSIRSSTTDSCTRPMAGARCTRSTRERPTRASSSG
jgi:glucose dehydrogenase